jgi:hypothetical protein
LAPAGCQARCLIQREYRLTLTKGLTRRATLARQWLELFETYAVLLMPVSGELPFPDNLDLKDEKSFTRVWHAQSPLIPENSPTRSFAERLSARGLPTVEELYADKAKPAEPETASVEKAETLEDSLLNDEGSLDRVSDDGVRTRLWFVDAPEHSIAGGFDRSEYLGFGPVPPRQDSVSIT